jgi:GNAT superfamily N-acetyltransferase
MQLRLATPEDIPVLNALISRSARELSIGFYSPAEIDAACRYVFGVDSQLVRDGTYFVAELDGVTAGCGGWSTRQTLYGGDQRPVGEAALLDPQRDAARIRAFFVAPEFARRGVGRRLLVGCTDAARRAGFAALELMATLPGVPFYQALGFSAVRHATDMLPDGTPLRFVHMRRSLTD